MSISAIPQKPREAIGEFERVDSPTFEIVSARREAAAAAETENIESTDVQYVELDGEIFQKVEIVSELRAGYLVSDRCGIQDVVERNTLVKAIRA